MLGLLALFLSIQGSGGLASRASAWLPPGRARAAFGFVLYGAFLAAFLTVLFALFAVLSSLRSPYELWWWGLLIVGMFVLGFVADGRDKKKRG